MGGDMNVWLAGPPGMENHGRRSLDKSEAGPMRVVLQPCDVSFSPLSFQDEAADAPGRRR